MLICSGFEYNSTTFLDLEIVVYIKSRVYQWYSGALSRPLELMAGLSIFATVAAGGLVRHVASTSIVVLLVASFFYVRSWPDAWRQLTSAERLVLSGFGLYVISAFLSYYNVSDDSEYIKHMGKYARFLAIVPVYLLISGMRLKLWPYLLSGAILAGPLYFGTALLAIAERPDFPAQGYYHHITFGDMAMLNAMFMTTLLVVMKMNKLLKIILLISVVCTFYASVLSQARGAWLALPFCLVLLLYAAVQYKNIRVWTVLIVSVVFVMVVVLSPAGDIVSSRWQKAVHEIEDFHSGGSHLSSVGVRLAMWDAAVNVWKDYPVVGTGPGDFDLEMRSDQVQKLYENMPANSSAHNNYFQALATTGAIGFIALCLSLIVLPFRLFYKCNKENLNVAAISGMVTITAFAVFGFTESWILRAPVVTVYLLYFVTLATAAVASSNIADTLPSSKSAQLKPNIS